MIGVFAAEGGAVLSTVLRPVDRLLAAWGPTQPVLMSCSERLEFAHKETRERDTFALLRRLLRAMQ